MTYQGKLILVLDQDTSIHTFVNQSLSPLKARIYSLSSAAEFLGSKSEPIPDLVIMDLVSEGTEGIEVCREIRNQTRLRHILIAVYTSITEDYKQIDCLDAGADDFILKPCRSTVFLHRIGALMRRASSYSLSRSNDLVIDPERYTVKKENREISLTRMEFNLIALLYSSPGKVFTRDEIYKNVWGGIMEDSNRTIDVHIRKLREKIGDEQILTIKGVGYKYS